MNRKADSISETFMLLVITVLVIVLILGVRASVSSTLENELKIGNLEANILFDRFLYSEDCIAYSNSLRTYISIVDLSKLNQDRINNCLKRDELAIKAEYEGNIFYNNDYLYKSIMNECNVKKSRIICIEKTMPVVLIDNNKKYNSFFKVNLLYKQKEGASNA